jgi:hypothetical protein
MMKLSEFVLTHTKGKNALDLEYFADVAVTTGALWWKKCERRKIHREFAGSWHFVDTGTFTPCFQAEDLERSYKAREALCAL